MYCFCHLAHDEMQNLQHSEVIYFNLGFQLIS